MNINFTWKSQVRNLVVYIVGTVCDLIIIRIKNKEKEKCFHIVQKLISRAIREGAYIQ